MLLANPELPEPDVGGFAGLASIPLKRLVSDPRDEPAEGSADQLELPTPEPAPWQAWWQEHGPRFESERRYRRGVPFTPRVALDELAGAALSFPERVVAGDELLILSGCSVGFDATDFVIRQRRALEAWIPSVDTASYPAGGWLG